MTAQLSSGLSTKQEMSELDIKGESPFSHFAWCKVSVSVLLLQRLINESHYVKVLIIVFIKRINKVDCLESP